MKSFAPRSSLLLCFGVAFGCSEPVEPTATVDGLWCTSAPIPAPWRRSDAVGAVLRVETEAEYYGAGVDAGHGYNHLELGISRANIGNLIFAGDRLSTWLSNGTLRESAAPVVSVPGYITYEYVSAPPPVTLVLSHLNGHASGRCTIYETSGPPSYCDFFIDDGLAIRAVFPLDAASALPQVLTDLRATIDYVESNCSTEN